MNPPSRDLFKPPPEKSFTKGEVNRAGQLVCAFFNAPRDDGQDPLDGWDSEDLVNAMYAVTWWKYLHARPLSKVAANLRYHVEQENGAVAGKIEVTQRLKKRDTIISKLERYPHMALTQMHDIGGVRARLPSLACVNAVSRRLRKTWTIVKTRDYLAKSKESGYRAIHHDVRRDGRVIEVQLRTVRQDAWANQVEDDGRALGTGYKFGFGAESIHGYYRIMAEIFWYMDSDQPITAELQSELRVKYEKVRGLLRPSSSRGGK
jgi:ppGpp synthetase/RelA/SpoT-type nucleotidyltranferase